MSIFEDFAFTPKKLGLIVVGIILLYIGFNTIRNARIDALARAAVDKKADPTVVAKLAGYRGVRSAELLLGIAGTAPARENRMAAIRALVDKQAWPLVWRLSELMVPPEALVIRQEIANALYKGGCSPECVKNVLYFQEAMAHGARPSEDVQADPPTKLSPAEQELQNTLDEVLKKNKASTGLVLAKVYGLASDFPSPFATDTVQRLGLREACPLLLHTYLNVNDQVRASPEYAYVAKAVIKLQCPGPQAPR
jgi:hypothetical protein